MPQDDFSEELNPLPEIEEPEYPAITLRIANHTPSIVYNKAEGDSKILIASDVGLDTALMQLAEKVELEAELEGLLAELYSADELFIPFPTIDVVAEHETEQPRLRLQPLIAHAEKFSAQTRPAPITALATASAAALNAELLRNWGLDVLASAQEEIYNLLIAHTVYLADELAVPRIRLHDERVEPRLREKMSKELGAAGVPLVVL